MRERPPDESTGGEGGASGSAGASRFPDEDVGGRPSGSRAPPARPPGDGGGDDDEAAPGWFPSWGALYATVIVYTAALTFLLWVFSVTLDYGAP